MHLFRGIVNFFMGVDVDLCVHLGVTVFTVLYCGLSDMHGVIFFKHRVGVLKWLTALTELHCDISSSSLVGKTALPITFGFR